MISKGNHVKFARFVWLAVGEEAKQRPGLRVNVYCRDIFVCLFFFFFVQCIIKQLLDSVLWCPEQSRSRKELSAEAEGFALCVAVRRWRSKTTSRFASECLLNDAYEINHMWTADMKSNEEWSSQLWSQFLQLRKHMNPQLTCSQRQWLHSSVGRASHRYREVTGSSPVEVLNFFSGFFTQLQKLRS